MSDKKEKKGAEFRINYIEDDGVFVGYFTNHDNVLVQRNSLEELEEALISTLKLVLNHTLGRLEKVEKGDSFIEVKPLSDKQWKELYKK